MAGVIHGLGGLREIFQCGMKIESVEDTVILLSQLSCISFRISNEIRILDISLEGFHVN